LTDTDGNVQVVDPSGGVSTVSFSATNYDAFGRFRVSQPFTLFDSANVNYMNTKFTQYCNPSGSGPTNNTVSYNVSGSTVDLICNISGTVVREGKYLCSYQPGKSLLIMNTFVMNSSQTNLIQRVGYYNDKNGIFLELNGSTLNIVKRSSVSGALVNTSVVQSSWNTNTMLSGTPTLDITKPQIFWIDIEWLGVGSVRTGFVIDNTFYIAHIFRHANDPDGSSTYGTYMTSARLSPRYEIVYNGASSGLNYKLKQICSTVISEGGYEAKSIVRHIGYEANMTNIPNSGAGPSAWIPLMAIKLDDTSKININGIMIPSQLSILYSTANGNGNLLYQILLNPTISGATVTFQNYNSTYPQDPNSVAKYWFNPSGTTFTVNGGIIINSGLLTSGSTIALSSANDFNLQIGRNYLGNDTYTSDVIAIAIKLLSIGNTPELYSQIGWYEI
jgi:hypothetical protein